MWKWFNCYLSGRHDFGVWCESGSVFLRCVHCGRRSTGWEVHAHRHATASPAPAPTLNRPLAASSRRIVPFERRAS